MSSPGSCPSETDIPPVDAVLAKINSFKNSIASEAGNNSVSLRAFQTAEIGDIYILDQNDESIQSYIGSAEVVVPLGEADEESRIANLGSFSVDFEWKKSYEQEVNFGFEFVNLVIESAFSFEIVDRVEFKLTIVNAKLTGLREPAFVLQSYESVFGNGEIKGNVLVTSVLTGHLKVQFTAYNETNDELTLTGDLVAGKIGDSVGVSAGYAQAVTTTTYIGAVQESSDDSTVFAVTYLAIDQSKQNIAFINNQLETDDANDFDTTEYVINRVIVDTIDRHAIAEVEIHQVVTESSTGSAFAWDVTITNVYHDPATISLTFVIDFYNSAGEFIFRHEDSVQHLGSGDSEYLGVISNEEVLLKFVVPELSNIVWIREGNRASREGLSSN